MRRSSPLLVLLLGTLTAFLTGCSRNPVAPISSPIHGAESAAGIQTDDVPTDVDGGTPSIVTAQILPTEQGRLTVGRFTLDLHKNTLKMPATITMQVASDDAMEVQIDVSPAEANDFQVAAELTADMSDQPNADLQNLTVFAWDGAAWQDVEASPHTNRGNLVAKLKQAKNSSVGAKPNKAETAQAAKGKK